MGRQDVASLLHIAAGMQQNGELAVSLLPTLQPKDMLYSCHELLLAVIRQHWDMLEFHWYKFHKPFDLESILLVTVEGEWASIPFGLVNNHGLTGFVQQRLPIIFRTPQINLIVRPISYQNAALRMKQNKVVVWLRQSRENSDESVPVTAKMSSNLLFLDDGSLQSVDFPNREPPTERFYQPDELTMGTWFGVPSPETDQVKVPSGQPFVSWWRLVGKDDGFKMRPLIQSLKFYQSLLKQGDSEYDWAVSVGGRATYAQSWFAGVTQFYRQMTRFFTVFETAGSSVTIDTARVGPTEERVTRILAHALLLENELKTYPGILERET